MEERHPYRSRAPGVREGLRAVGLSCSPNAAHGNDQIVTLREVLVEARNETPISPRPLRGNEQAGKHYLDLEWSRGAVGATWVPFPREVNEQAWKDHLKRAHG